MADSSKLAPFSLLDEPALSFSPSDPKAVDVHPLRGLVNYGPFTQAGFGKYTPQIRVATVGPATGWDQRCQLMRILKQPHQPSDRKEYVPTYPGFRKVFRIDMGAAPLDAHHIKWPDDLVDRNGGAQARTALVEAMSNALNRLALVRDAFDVALVHLPDAWSAAFRDEGFDAHDTLKALAARHSIPTQVINDRAFEFSFKASVAWRLSIALYVKAGGIPWKLAPLPGVPADTAYIGLAYAMRGDPRDARFITCCSQVFDVDGGGMEFVAFDAKDPVLDMDDARRNPFLSRDDMRAVMARSLSLYQRRNSALPRRLVIHKTTAFREAEIEGAFEALTSIPEIECLEIGESPHWRAVWLVESGRTDPPSKPNGYPVPRGTMLPLSGTETLLWVAGNTHGVASSGDYFQGSKGIPRPLVLTRHTGAGPLELPAAEVLGLSKMDWNNDALYDPGPVTIRYSRNLARTIANVPDLPRNAYPYRLFM